MVNLTIYPSGCCTACAWASDHFKCSVGLDFVPEQREEAILEARDRFLQSLSLVFGGASADLEIFLKGRQDLRLSTLQQRLEQLQVRLQHAKCLPFPGHLVEQLEKEIVQFQEEYQRGSRLKDAQPEFFLRWMHFEQCSDQVKDLEHTVELLQKEVYRLKGRLHTLLAEN